MRLRSVCAQCGGPANPIGFKALSVSDRMRRLNMQVPVSTGPQCFLPQPSSLPLTHTHTHTHFLSLSAHPCHALHALSQSSEIKCRLGTCRMSII